MIAVSDETKREFLKDSSHKDINIEWDGISYEEINYFVGITGKSNPFSVQINKNDDDNYLLGGYYIRDNQDRFVSYLSQAMNLTKYPEYDFWYFSFYPQMEFGKIGSFNYKIKAITSYLKYNFNGQTYQTKIEITDENAIQKITEGTYRLRFRLPKSWVTLEGDYIKSLSYKIDYMITDLDESQTNKMTFDIGINKLMCTLSNIGTGYDYPPYVPTQIINGVFPEIRNISNIGNDHLIQESLRLTESLCSKDNLKFGLCEAAHVKFQVANYNDNIKNVKFKLYIKSGNEKIPLGHFKVDNIKKQISHNLTVKTVSAYDEMVSWYADATEWYKDYLYAFGYEYDVQGGPQDPRFAGMDVDFARQMYSTYYNFAKKLGYENDNDYIFRDDCVFTSAAGEELAGYTALFGEEVVLNNSKYRGYYVPREYAVPIDKIDSTRLYRIQKQNHWNGQYDVSDEYILDKIHQPNAKGILSKASVMVVEKLEDGSYNKFLVDVGDLFAISEDCIELSIFYGVEIIYVTERGYSVQSRIVTTLILQSTPAPSWTLDLINRSTRLLYYNWENTVYGINEVSSQECTIRDVFRSLFEINGAFCRINRYGKFECMYIQKSALYPSNHLYPSDNLYPIKGPRVLPTSRYIKSLSEDYISQDFGKIQIKSQNGTEGCTTLKTYIGNENLDSTYIIDDNIFYSNDLVKFDYYYNPGFSSEKIDVVPEVTKMLKNLYTRIKSTSYTPHETTTLGMPWMEVGDRITLITDKDAFESFIFRRTLSGVQHLLDVYEAKGDDIIRANKDYE